MLGFLHFYFQSSLVTRFFVTESGTEELPCQPGLNSSCQEATSSLQCVRSATGYERGFDVFNARSCRHTVYILIPVSILALYLETQLPSDLVLYKVFIDFWPLPSVPSAILSSEISSNRSQWPGGLRRGMQTLACWDFGFESRRREWISVPCQCCVLSEISNTADPSSREPLPSVCVCVYMSLNVIKYNSNSLYLQ